MSNERDELADILHGKGAYCGSCGYEDGQCSDCKEVLTGYADAILAAGYSKPRAITTEAELDRLPVGSVIRTAGVEDECDPRVAVKAAFWHNESEWFTADDSEWCLSSDELDDLPAIVLYTPEVST